MRAGSALFVDHFPQLRLYGFAVLLYMAIASLFIVPAAQKQHTKSMVADQLSQYLREKSVNKKAGSSLVLAASGTPTAIHIDRLHINLPVAPGYYNQITHKWTLDGRHVFTDNYTNPNPIISAHQEKTMFIYGHDIPGVLVGTSGLVHGDILTIDTQNGYQFRYYYEKSRVLNPTDTSVLNEENTGDPVILATCTGAWYQFRHAMYFKLLSIRKLRSGPMESVSG